MWKVKTLKDIFGNYIIPRTRTAAVFDDENNTLDTVINTINNRFYNPNLLDNPWFTINQRGLNNWTSPIFTVDRWFGNIVSGTGIALNSDDTITLNGVIEFYERLEISNQLHGKTVTMSVMLSNGTIVYGTGIVNNTGTWHMDIQKSITTNSELRLVVEANGAVVAMVYANGDNITIKAIKLEIGSISTLHLDSPPNPQVELAKCQRYYEIISTGALAGTSSGVSIRTGIQFKVSKRVSTPTVIIRSYDGVAGKISYYDSGWKEANATVLVDGSAFIVESTLPASNVGWGGWAEVSAEL